MAEGDSSQVGIQKIDELSVLVSTNYVIMKRVLSYLNFPELKTAETVCKFWSSVVQILLKNQTLHTFVSEFNKRSLKNGEPCLNCCSKAPSDPSFLLLFCMPEATKIKVGCNELPSLLCESPCHKKHRVLEYIYSKFSHPLIPMLGIICSDTVYTTLPLQRKDDYLKMAGFSFPKIPGVSVRLINVDKDECTSFHLKNNTTLKTITDIMDTDIIKCLLIFTTSKVLELQKHFIEKFVAVVIKCQDEHPFAVCGCSVDDTIQENFNESNNINNKDYVNIIILSVPKNDYNKVELDCISQIINVYEKNVKCLESYVEKKIRQMADCIKKRQHSVALKLTCYGRESYHDTEIGLFAKHFPSTPLFGCLSSGEIGKVCLLTRQADELDKDEPYCKRKRTFGSNDDGQTVHCFSTVFLVLSWGKLL